MILNHLKILVNMRRLILCWTRVIKCLNYLDNTSYTQHISFIHCCVYHIQSLFHSFQSTDTMFCLFEPQTHVYVIGCMLPTCSQCCAVRVAYPSALPATLTHCPFCSLDNGKAAHPLQPAASGPVRLPAARPIPVIYIMLTAALTAQIPHGGH